LEASSGKWLVRPYFEKTHHTHTHTHTQTAGVAQGVSSEFKPQYRKKKKKKDELPLYFNKSGLHLEVHYQGKFSFLYDTKLYNH
jgi:hypothetical protein